MIKDKIVKLIDIWERAATFSPQLLAALRSHFKVNSTTPPRPPPSYLTENGKSSATPAPAQSTSSILEALANMAKPGSTASQTPTPALPTAKPNGVQSLQDIISSATKSATAAPSQTPAPPPPPPSSQAPIDLTSLLAGVSQTSLPPTSTASATPDMASLLPLLSGQQQYQPQPQMQIPGFPGFQAPQPQAPTANVEQQVALMQLLLAQGMPLTQVASILQAAGGAMQPAQPASQTPSWPPMNPDRRARERSRSPRGRRSPDYRSRSPRGYRSPSPPGRIYPRATVEKRPKSVSRDPTVPSGCIRVLSRTLFVGGVPSHMSEEKLISIFEQCCPVQSVIMNKDKRCAFVKVYYRSDAEVIKNTMETYSEEDFTLRCRWGVGFGPRDCCEYSSGVSTIPIDRLTDADKRWVTTAEYGGTGGQRLEDNLVIEEPDIEIGAGVSSKAISRRMPTNQGGDMGPKSSEPDIYGMRARRGRRGGK